MQIMSSGVKLTITLWILTSFTNFASIYKFISLFLICFKCMIFQILWISCSILLELNKIFDIYSFYVMMFLKLF